MSRHALELFAGAGGASLGLHAAGFGVASYDYDADSVATHRQVPGTVTRADLSDPEVRAATARVHPRPGLLWASPPCQPFSTAGRREGAADTARNGWPWALDIIDRTAPDAVIVENVPGLRLHRKGCLPLLRLGPEACPGCYGHAIEEDLRARYPHVAVWTLDAADFGVPQHRRRVFYVATHRWIHPPLATHGPGLLPFATMRQALGLDHPVQHQSATAGAAPRSPDDPAPSVSVSGKGTLYVVDPKHPALHPDRPCTTIRSGGNGHSAPPIWLLDAPAPTVSATEVKGAGARATRRARGEHVASSAGPDRPSDVLLMATGRRRLTIAECAILQDFPPAFAFTGTKTSQYRQVGNAVPPRLAEVVARAITPRGAP